MPETAPKPCDFVVIGGTGDLAMRKLLPALLHCDDDDRLNPDSRLVSLSLAGLDTDAYREKIRGELHNASVNIVMLTTESSPVMKERGKAAGVKGWIVKPFKGDAVIATFKKLAGA